MSRLEGSLFQRADLALRRPGQEDDRPDSAKESRCGRTTCRTCASSAWASARPWPAMAAAGVVVATGGAALPAVARRRRRAAATAAAGEAVGQAAAPKAHGTRTHRPRSEGGVVLMVHADTPEKQAKAEELLRACGATRVWKQDTA